MGLFNALSSIEKVNRLLKDYENQVVIFQGQLDYGASTDALLNSWNVLSSIHQELINTFGNSGGARTAVYKVFGEKMRMHEVLTYSKNVLIAAHRAINSQ